MMVMVMTLLFIPKIELLFSHRQHCRLSNFTFFLILRRLPQPPESGCRISPNLAKLAKTAFFAKNPSPRYFLIGKFFQMRVDFLQVRMTLWHMPSLILSVFCPMTFHFLSEKWILSYFFHPQQSAWSAVAILDCGSHMHWGNMKYVVLEKYLSPPSRASLTVRITVKNGDPSRARKIWENRFFTWKMDLHGAKRIQIGEHTCQGRSRSGLELFHIHF